jgi:Asp-tRNA(Asn)/Glu-tRNA(Gln) amidotransferase A subunit family amidase
MVDSPRGTPSTRATNSDQDGGLATTSALDLAAAIRARRVSPVEVVTAVLERIDRYEPAVNAYITLLADQALEDARRAERQVMATPIEALGRLHGVPISVKDLTPTAGVRTTFGLKEYVHHVPEKDSIAWARLKKQGPVLIGKTATPPLGALCVTESEVNGTTNNPWDLSRTVGGSSGGSAAALAAGFGTLATGSDGGASIRLPAGYCGVVGLNPSSGRIPGDSELNRFDTSTHVGPMARTVAECALLFSIMSGPHSRDPFSLPAAGVDYVDQLDAASLKGRRIALCVEGFGPVEADVVEVLTEAARRMESEIGAEVEFVSMDLPDPIDYFHDFWVTSMAGDEMAGLDFTAYPPVVRWMEMASTASAARYLDAAFSRRAKIHEAFATVFDRFDFLITPTAPQVAFPHPDPIHRGATHCAGVEVREPAIDMGRFTDPPTQANLPSITIPCGFSAGLPVGMQIIGRHADEAGVLQAAAAFEAMAGLTNRVPRL